MGISKKHISNDLSEFSDHSVPDGFKTVWKEIARLHRAHFRGDKTARSEIAFRLKSVSGTARYSRSEHVLRRQMAKTLRKLRKAAKFDPTIALKLSEHRAAGLSCWKIVRARRDEKSVAKSAQPGRVRTKAGTPRTTQEPPARHCK